MDKKLVTRFIYAWLLQFIVTMLFLVAGIVYVAKESEERAREICEVVIAQDDAYKELPPSTPTGQNIARALHDLRERQCT